MRHATDGFGTDAPALNLCQICGLLAKLAAFLIRLGFQPNTMTLAGLGVNLIGAAFLMYRGYISWHIPLSFLATVAGIQGMPVEAVVLGLVFSLGLMGVLTPYATGPAPVWYSAGYISTTEFWKLGGLMGLLYLGTLLVLGFPYALYLAG